MEIKHNKKMILVDESVFMEDNGLPITVWCMMQDEHVAQIEKWGHQTHNIWCWLGFLVEEVGELSNAISEYIYRGGDVEDISDEAIQVAVLAGKISDMANRLPKQKRGDDIASDPGPTHEC